MDINEKAEEAMRMLDTQIGELLSIKEAFKNKEISSIDGLEKISQWKLRTVKLLSEKVHPQEAKNLDEKSEWTLSGEPLTSFRKTSDMYFSFLTTLKEKIEKQPRDILSAPVKFDPLPFELKKRRLY